MADVKTHNEKSSLEFALETALNMSAGLEVEILDVYRGAPINLTSENSTDPTILKIKVVSTAGTELTSSQLHGIHDKVMDNMGKAKYDKGFNLGATYGWAEITSPTQIDGTIPIGTHQAGCSPRRPLLVMLPGSSRSFHRPSSPGSQGHVRGRFRGHQHGLHAVPRRSGFPGHRYGHPPGVVMILMIIACIRATICGDVLQVLQRRLQAPQVLQQGPQDQQGRYPRVRRAHRRRCLHRLRGGPALMEHTSDLTQAMADTISDLLAGVRDVGAAVGDVSGIFPGADGFSATLDQLDEGTHAVEDTIQEAQDQLDEYLKIASDTMIISYGVLFGVTYFVFAAAIIGWWRLLILITVFLSVLMIVAWLGVW